jgi:hypothetical protein
MIYNIKNESQIKCGEIAKKFKFRPNVPNFNADIISPIATSDSSIGSIVTAKLETLFKSTAERAAKSSGDTYRGLSISSINILNSHSKNFLYPIWISSYHFKGKDYKIQIDGVTGKAWVQLPGSVIAKRIIKWVLISMLVIFILLLVIGAVGAMQSKTETGHQQTNSVNH